MNFAQDQSLEFPVSGPETPFGGAFKDKIIQSLHVPK